MSSSSYSERFDQLRSTISAQHREQLDAVRSTSRAQLAAAAARELRDTARHDEAMRAQAAVQRGIDAVHASVSAGMERIADHLLEQTIELRRIADAVENPLGNRARELREMALRHFRAGELPKAESLLEQSFELDGTVHATFVALAFVRRCRGRHDEAVDLLVRSLPHAPRKMDLGLSPIVDLPLARRRSEERPARAVTLQMAARIRAEQGRWDDAARLLLQAIGHDHVPGPAIIYELTFYYTQAGDVASAATAFVLLLRSDSAVAVMAARDESLAALQPFMEASLEAERAARARRGQAALADAETKIARVRTLGEKLRRARAETSEPQPGWQSYADAVKAIDALRSHLKGNVLLDSTRYDLAARSAVDALNVKLLRRELRSWRATQVLASGCSILLATVAVVIVLVVGLAIAAIVFDGDDEAAAIPPLAVLPVDRPARTQVELGRRLAEVVIASAPPNAQMDDSVNTPLWVAQGAMMEKAVQAGANAPGVAWGFLAHVRERTQAEGRYGHLMNVRARLLRGLQVTSEEQFDVVSRTSDGPLTPEILEGLKEIPRILEEAAARPATPERIRVHYRQLHRQIIDEIERAQPAG